MAAAVVPLTPNAAIAATDPRRDVLEAMASLPDAALWRFPALSVSLTRSHWLRPQVLEMLDAGRSFDEIDAALQAAVDENCARHG